MAGRFKQKARSALRKIGKQSLTVGKKVGKAAFKAAKNELKQEVRSLINQVKPRLNNVRGLIRGMGDYEVLGSNTGGVNQPSFGSTTSTFRKREFVSKIVSSAAAGEFKLDKFTINCGDGTCFPWLSGLANNYESWCPKGIIFEYIPTSGMAVASSNTALGVVVMATQYNPYAVDPNNRVRLEGYPNAVSFAPYQRVCSGVECVPSKRQAETLLIRNSSVGPSTGLVIDGGADTLFDLGQFFIATEGVQDSAVTLGELWITYDIQLLNPIVPVSLPFNQGFLVSFSGASGSNDDMFGSADYAITPYNGNQTALSVQTTSLNTFIFDNLVPGTWMLQLNLFLPSSATAYATPSWTLDPDSTFGTPVAEAIHQIVPIGNVAGSTARNWSFITYFTYSGSGKTKFKITPSVVIPFTVGDLNFMMVPFSSIP